ncbi:hemicentin-1-like isoform X2 [Periplaneta americana]|uniref:hemicentin-1-like isoform X2 n=1 Tax=Periplaneta americana TaxID=6978 RepID=UPI0037E70338
MGGQSAVHWLILLSITTIRNAECVNPQSNVDIFDGSGGGSGQVTSSRELTDTQVVTTLNGLELSSTESSVVQDQLLSDVQHSSTEELSTTFLRLNNSNLSPDENKEDNQQTAILPLNSNELQQDVNELEQVKDELSDSITSYVSAEENKQNVASADINANITTDMRNNSNSAMKDEDYEDDIFKQPYDENSFNQLLNDMGSLSKDLNDSATHSNSEKNVDNLEDYNSQQSQNQKTNDQKDASFSHQIQSDSPFDHSLNNSLESDDIFEKVFNISVEDEDGEHPNYFTYQADSRHRTQYPPKSTDVSALNNASYRSQSDDNNLHPSLDSIFEVYHYARNDTNQNKTLAHHIEEIVLNRLPSLQNRGANASSGQDVNKSESEDDEDEEVDEDDDIGNGLEPLSINFVPDEDKEEEEEKKEEEEDGEETPSGASLAFVFDSTGSMWNDLVQVKMGAERIMATMLERPDKPIYNYVLVPFHDPKIGPVTITTDHKEFRESLQNITVHGGGDCPEMAVGAVKEALSASLPNSFIYVFTDARAKDYHLITEVLALIQRKQSQVVFVMTGDCGDNKHVGYQVFEKIASTSSGQVYHLNKTDVEEVLQFVRMSLQSRKVNLLSVNNPGPSRDEHNLFVDESLQEFTVSVSGLNPQIGVVDPKGKPVEGPPQLNTVLSLQNIKAINVVEPQPGQWTVKVGSDSEHSVRSTGLSDVDFNFGFSAVPTDKMEETYHRPLRGEKNAVLVEPTQKGVVYNLTSLKLIDLKGIEFQEIPLHPVPGKPGLYQGPMFVPPNDFFHLGVEGFDNDGFPLKRISPTAITGQSPAPPVVNMKHSMTGWLNKPVRIRCHVESLIPFFVMWFKDGQPLTGREKYEQTAELFWEVQNPTVGAEGNYSCFANNVAGRASSGTWLKITGPAPRVETPPQIITAPNKSAALDCVVHSQLRYDVKWARILMDPTFPENENIQMIRNDGKTIVMPNGTLIVNSVNLEDQGWYTCIAENKGGKSEGQVYLAVKEPVHVVVTPDRFQFQQGDSITLSCHATGTPKPEFVWKKDGHILKEGNGRKIRLSQHDRGLDILINDAKSSDAGEYQCVAENDEEVDVGITIGKYLEPPTVISEEGRVRVKVGDTALLRCVATGSPPPIIRWTKSDDDIFTNSKYQVQGDGTLLISNTQVTDKGEYTCIAENELGIGDDFISLEVGMPPQMVQLPKDTQIEINTNGMVPCLAIGVPVPHISWTRKDGKQFNATHVKTTEHGSLQITNATVEVSGTYICRVENTFGKTEYEACVNVTGVVKPVFDSKYSSQPTTTVKRGMLVELPCHIILSNPPPTITWYKDGEILDQEQMQWEGIIVLTNGSLVISYTTQEHEGTYECVASNVGGTVSQATNLHVLEPPSFPPGGSVEFKVRAGEEIILPCPALGDPEPIVFWKKDGMPLILSHTVYKNSDDNSLIITSANVADSGIYMCIAVNPAGEGSKAMALFVQVPPHIAPGTDTVNAIDGQIVTLKCEVEAIPDPVITWYKDEAPLYSYGDEVMYLDNNATIRFVAHFGSSGQYRCEAVNDAGSDRFDMSLVVFVPPSIYPAEDEIHIVNATQSVSLNCFGSGYPQPEINWQRNGMDIVNDTNVSVSEDGILNIIDIQPNQAGVYVCDAENEAGIIQKIFYLVVHVPPKIEVDFPTQIKLMDGDDYSLPCSAHGIPSPEISWRRDGQPIIGQNNENLIVLDDGTLVITSATLNTTGIYTCVAENTKGSAQKHFLVEILVPPSMMDPGNSSLEVIEGDSVVIACPPMDAIPPPQIQWLKDGKPLDFLTNERSDQVHFTLLDGGRTLQLEETHAADSGIYACVATNLAGRTNAEIKLNVLLAPYIEEFNYKREKTVVAGTEVKFDCNMTGNPAPRISWRKNNLPITPHTAPGVMLSPNKLSLIIPNVRPHDSGRYQCSATNKAGRNDRDFVLSVLVPPDLDGPVEEVQDVVKGEPILLQCPITGLPNPHIKWTKDGLDLNIKATNIILSKDKRILEISKVQPHDGGIYVCNGSNEAASKEKHFNLTVFEPPVIHQQLFVEEVKVRVSDNASLVCTTRGNPKPDIKWLHNGRIVEKGTTSVASNSLGDRSSIEEHTLFLQKVEIPDAGKYTCLASNIAGVTEKNYRLKVLVAPKISGHREDSNVIESLEGLPITIKCPVVGNPVPDIHWMKDSLPLNTQEAMRAEAEGQMLYIKNSKQEHSGNYTCVAHNHAGNVSKSFQLDVLVPPVMADMEELTNFNVTTNETLTLTCNVTGHPHPSISWFKGVTPINKEKWPRITLLDHNRTLIIPNVSTQHKGKYSCLASNMAGDTELTFNVEIQEPPKASKDVSEKSNHTVQLHRRLVLKCPLHGSPQPKITWYKEGNPIQKQLGNNIHISSDGKQLHFMHASTANSGNYSCVAENSAGMKELHFEVNVVVPAEWSAWSSWSDCSVTCGLGEQIRVRICGEDSDDFVDESNCQGDSEQVQSCHMSECPIDGAWSDWSNWTSCSVSCGRGTRRRYRKCNNPSPAYGGKPCLGADGQQEYCNQPTCPVHGKWSDWSDWSLCSVSCNNGTQHRTRKCNNPLPAFGGKECIGPDMDFKDCNLHKCPVNGDWSIWSEWSSCSVSCGHGNKRRFRTCTNPAPQYKGSPCKGENLQIEKCMARSCGNIPLVAALHVKGNLNGESLHDSVIAANISDMGPRRAVSTTIKDIIRQQAGWFPYLTFLLSPVSWNAAYEVDEANNGYSLTNGNFRQQSQIEFATGEELVVTHVGRGIDEVGTLQVDIEVNGEVPLMQPEASVHIEPYEEDYVQTSPNSLYASSTSTLNVNGKKLPYSWNNTVSYDTFQGTMPYLVEKLSARDIDVDYNPDLQEMTYMMTTVIGKRFDNDKCPEGFIRDEQHLHCRDIDECQERRTNRCHYTQICENLFGSYRCFCHPGYKSKAIGKRCLDVNECMENPSVCSHQCRNVKGSYKCICPRGYVLLEDGKTCSGLQYWNDRTDLYPNPGNERSHFPPQSSLGLRSLSPGHRRNSGYEYFEDNDYKPNHQSPQHIWSRIENGWGCPQGFEPSNGICQDVNECKIAPNLCTTDQTCLNTKGTYRCLETPCPSGYERDMDTRNCVQFCDEPGVNCKEGALLTQTISYVVLTLDNNEVQPYQDLMQLTVFGEDGRQLPRTRYRIVENETGKPFRVRIENGQGILYTLKSLKLGRLYRIVVLALSYDEDEHNILYTTKYVIFVNLLDDS